MGESPSQQDGKKASYTPFDGGDFEAFVDKTLSDFHTPGLAVAVIDKDRTYSKGYGHAHLASKDPVTPRTLFYMASTTKSFTAAAVSKLVYSDKAEYENIDWNTRLSSLIPEDFVLQDKHAQEHITLIDVLCHRTGMPRHDMSRWNRNPSLREGVQQLRYLPLHREMRVALEYSNIMYSVASYAILRATGYGANSVKQGVDNMKELFGEWFWKPLGMESTFYDVDDALAYVDGAADKRDDKVNIAHGYLYDEKTNQFVQTRWDDLPPASGASGIISNALDYCHWIRAFLHPDRSHGALSEEIVKDLTAPRMPTDLSFLPDVHGTGSYNLGLTTATYHDVRLICHKGALAGYMCVMLWMPEKDWGCVLMQNSYSYAYEIVQWKLIDDFLGLEGKARFDAVASVRERESKSKERMVPGKVRRRLYPSAPELANVAPALPLTAYEGTYKHPAYGEMELSTLPQKQTQATAEGEETHAKGLPDAPLPLYAGLSRYSQVGLTFHHVNGEHWLVHLKHGPGSWLVDDALKANFEIGVSGKVAGLRLQAEPAIEELAWFEKEG